jgi:sulfide:quinone oxidoreductase
MKPSLISPHLSASRQISQSDVADAKAAGFRSILCNRPDGEAAEQPPFAAIAREAGRFAASAKPIVV